MRKSRARQALESALSEASTAEQRATIASKLSALVERESRTRARQQRMKARTKAEAAKDADAPEPYDPNAEFVLETYPAVIVPPLRPDPLAEKRKAVASAPAEPAPAEPPPPPPFDGRSTRELPCMSPLLVWDYERGGWQEDLYPRSSVGPQGAWDPWSAEACAAVESNAHSNEDGFSWRRRDPKTGELVFTNQRLERERKEQDQRDHDKFASWGGIW
jgi:hypothetical protein